MQEFLRDFWGAIVAAVGLIAWIIRLEARSLSNAEEIRRLWAQRREDLDAARAARSETNVLLSELRSDIKTLLRRTSE